MAFEREILQCTDGGQVGLDWALPAAEGATPETPVLVVLHGLNGGSMENYVRHFIRRAEAALHCRTVVMIARGLGGVPLATWRPYNAGRTDDFRETVSEIHRRYPSAKIVAVGFSMGANVLTRYVAEEGESCLLTAAVGVSNPFDLAGSTQHLEASGRMGRLYSRNMAQGLHRFTKKNRAMLETAPMQVDIEGALRARLCRDYDNLATCKMFGFETADEYYRAFSSLPLIKDVRRPLLLISAVDDPISGPVPLERAVEEAQHTPYVAIAASPRGGHVAFLEAAPGKPLANWWHAEDSWADTAACEFLAAALF